MAIADKYMILNAVYYIFVFVAIGVPIWCLTTTTYRAALPFDEIDQINARETLELSIKFSLIYLNHQTKPEKLTNELEELLNEETKKSTIGLVFNYLVNGRQADSIELKAAENAQKIEG